MVEIKWKIFLVKLTLSPDSILYYYQNNNIIEKIGCKIKKGKTSKKRVKYPTNKQLIF